MTTAVIVQARMRSTRLPGKTLLPLGAGTVLSEVLGRCAEIRGADFVCCAVPEGAADDPVAREGERAGAVVVRGDENDLLGRYLKAARNLGADVVLRVTSDCPLIDPAICDAVLALRATRGADYACNNMPRGFPHGLDCEAFTTAVLERADRCAHDPGEREHVTPWVREREGFARANLDGPGGEPATWRWTLDHPEDYEFLRALFEVLPRPVPHAWQAVAEIVRRTPGLTEINNCHRAV